MVTLDDRFTGSLLGLALADALGARHEGGAFGAVAWWLAGGRARGLLRWTDDTEMAIGLAESLIARRALDPDHLARRWAEGMDPRRGYGSGARKLLERIRAGEDWRTANRGVFPDGSFGNGAAMRAAPLGLFFHRDLKALRQAADLASGITHAHPLGMEGGRLIAWAVALALRIESPFDADAFLAALLDACELEEYRSRLQRVRMWLLDPPWLPEIRRHLGTSVLAHESSVTAIDAFCRYPSHFLAMMEHVIELGGDTDTIGAMAGGIFGARNGVSSLPEEWLGKLEMRDEIEALARRLHASLPPPAAGRSVDPAGA